MLRRVIVADQISKFKHRLVVGDRAYGVISVRYQPERVMISIEADPLQKSTMYLLAAKSPITVELIDDAPEPDPSEPPSTGMASMVAKPKSASRNRRRIFDWSRNRPLSS